MKPLAPKDIPIQKLTELKWDKDSAEASLTRVYEHVIRLRTDAANWYLKAKRPKQRLAYALRFWAIISTVAAGIVPVLAEIWKVNGVSKISPGYASVLLLISALFIFLDQFLGCSPAGCATSRRTWSLKTCLNSSSCLRHGALRVAG